MTLLCSETVEMSKGSLLFCSVADEVVAADSMGVGEATWDCASAAELSAELASELASELSAKPGAELAPDVELATTVTPPPAAEVVEAPTSPAVVSVAESIEGAVDDVAAASGGGAAALPPAITVT